MLTRDWRCLNNATPEALVSATGIFATFVAGAGDDAAGGGRGFVKQAEADDVAFDGFDERVGEVRNDQVLPDGQADLVRGRSWWRGRRWRASGARRDVRPARPRRVNFRPDWCWRRCPEPGVFFNRWTRLAGGERQAYQGEREFLLGFVDEFFDAPIFRGGISGALSCGWCGRRFRKRRAASRRRRRRLARGQLAGRCPVRNRRGRRCRRVGGGSRCRAMALKVEG